MSIHRIGSDLIRPPKAKLGAEDSRASTKSARSDGAAGPDRGDRVEISDAGRALAAKIADAEKAAEARLEIIRDRLAEGLYHEPSVAENVAQRLVESGDLSELV